MWMSGGLGMRIYYMNKGRISVWRRFLEEVNRAQNWVDEVV